MDNPLELARLFFIGSAIVLSLHGSSQVNAKTILIEPIILRRLLYAQRNLLVLPALQENVELDPLRIYRGLPLVLNHLHGSIHKDRRADLDWGGNCN